MSTEKSLNTYLEKYQFKQFLQQQANNLYCQQENPLVYLNLLAQTKTQLNANFCQLMIKMPQMDLDIEINEYNIEKLQKISRIIDNIKFIDEEFQPYVINSMGLNWSGEGGITGLIKELFQQET